MYWLTDYHRFPYSSVKAWDINAFVPFFGMCSIHGIFVSIHSWQELVQSCNHTTWYIQFLKIDLHLYTPQKASLLAVQHFRNSGISYVSANYYLVFSISLTIVCVSHVFLLAVTGLHFSSFVSLSLFFFSLFSFQSFHSLKWIKDIFLWCWICFQHPTLA